MGGRRLLLVVGQGALVLQEHRRVGSRGSSCAPAALEQSSRGGLEHRAPARAPAARGDGAEQTAGAASAGDGEQTAGTAAAMAWAAPALEWAAPAWELAAPAMTHAR